MPTYSPEGATIAEILTAAKLKLVTDIGISSSKVFITFADDANPITPVKERHISIRVGAPSPDSFGGAGRRSTRVRRDLIVTAFTRMNLDQIRRNDLWYTKATTGHYTIEEAIVDSLHIRFLFSPAPESRKLTALPLHWFEGLQPPRLPTPEAGWGWSVLMFQIDYVQRMTLDRSLGE